ncbi:MAG: MtnX-like HAD-IB family phosphatase [Deltaproteobacteria bacterium]|nr:MtnX-like HAD-IB family phosphatase [Deltaproteobacteria bacterium]
MTANFFVAIDFDGTITGRDITDAVIQKFALPGWEEAETRWEKGLIGSRECLAEQMALIHEPLEHVLEYVDSFGIDPAFPDFLSFLRRRRVPHAVVSDGFSIFSERILSNAGITDVPVYANGLNRQDGRLKTFYPHAKTDCPSGTCKCTVAGDAGGGSPIILVGDGRSDFCLAKEAALVLSKGKLTNYCKENGITHRPFENFYDVKSCLQGFLTDQPGQSAGKVWKQPASIPEMA